MTRVLKSIPLAIVLALSLFVVLVSLRYALPEIPGAAPNVVRNRFAEPFLLIHVLGACAALLIGPFQFFRRKDGQRAVWHRLTGVLYMAACLVGATSGLVLALGTTSGPVAVAGFGLLALAWFWTTANGLIAVLRGRYEAHGRWMIRSFALAFAAVTLRLYLPLGGALDIPFDEAYRAISFLSWVPNLLVAEMLLAVRKPRVLAAT